MTQPPLLIGKTGGTPLGVVWGAFSPRGLVAVEFGVSSSAFATTVRRLTGRETQPAPPGTAAALAQIREYLQGSRRRFHLKIDWTVLASDFQRAALRAVLAIPYGQTRTYAEIARQIGQPQACRAVGRANATNPMPLVIPCHRVVGTDGKLHGYGGVGDLKTKAWLLRLEQDQL